MFGVATLGDRVILPQVLPIFYTLESLIIDAHLIRIYSSEKHAAARRAFIQSHTH
jgi:hypothetical protein